MAKKKKSNDLDDDMEFYRSELSGILDESEIEDMLNEMVMPEITKSKDTFKIV